MTDTPHPEAPSLPEPASIHLYTNRPSYSADQMRTVLAERDVAIDRREDMEGSMLLWQQRAYAYERERDALRQELEALRSHYAHQSAELITARTARTALLSAREGLKPLTDEQVATIFSRSHPRTRFASGFLRFARSIEAAHDITSATKEPK